MNETFQQYKRLKQYNVNRKTLQHYLLKKKFIEKFHFRNS